MLALSSMLSNRFYGDNMRPAATQGISGNQFVGEFLLKAFFPPEGCIS